MELFHKEEDLFTRLARSAEVMRKAGDVFSALVEPGAERTPGTLELAELKNQGDAMVHDIINRLNRSFITPIEREDIYALAVEVDGVTGAIADAAMMMEAYRLGEVEQGTRAQTAALCGALNALTAAIADLRHFKTPDMIRARCQEVAACEKQGDRAFMEGMRHLFAEVKDPFEIIKQKDIAEMIEKTLDIAADAADTIQNVLVKNA